MQSACKAAKAFKSRYSIRKVSAKTLSDAVEAQGYTVIMFNRVCNNADVAALIAALGLETAIKVHKGFTYANEKYRLVFVNEDLSENEKTLVLAHELGHIFCGHLTDPTVIGKDVSQEHEANEFAHYLMYPSRFEKMKLFFVRHKRAAIVSGACVLLAAATLAAVSVAAKENSYYGEYYVTEAGKKYHVKSCSFIKNKTAVRRLTTEEYQSGTYTPCKKCLPQE